ncbi:unnamed protein product [Chrysoparadoxa australica]
MLLDDEDRMWALEEYAHAANVARARSNKLKSQLLQVNLNFDDHLAARQQKITDLEKETKELWDKHNHTKAVLETERGEARRKAMEQEKLIAANAEAATQKIGALELELHELMAFKADKDKFILRMAEQKQQHELELEQMRNQMLGLQKQLEKQKEGEEEAVQTRFLMREAQLKCEVEAALGEEFAATRENNIELKYKMKQLQEQIHGLLKAMNKGDVTRLTMRREMSIMKDMAAHAQQQLKEYMLELSRLREENASLLEVQQRWQEEQEAQVEEVVSGPSRRAVSAGGKRLLKGPSLRITAKTRGPEEDDGLVEGEEEQSVPKMHEEPQAQEQAQQQEQQQEQRQQPVAIWEEVARDLDTFLLSRARPATASAAASASSSSRKVPVKPQSARLCGRRCSSSGITLNTVSRGSRCSTEAKMRQLEAEEWGSSRPPERELYQTLSRKWCSNKRAAKQKWEGNSLLKRVSKDMGGITGSVHRERAPGFSVREQVAMGVRQNPSVRVPERGAMEKLLRQMSEELREEEEGERNELSLW